MTMASLHLMSSTRDRLGRLAAWHLPDGPVGLPARWDATSNVEVSHMTYAVNRGKVGTEGREGSEGQSHKEEYREKEVERGGGLGPLAREGGLYLNICVAPPPPRVPSYATDGADLPT